MITDPDICIAAATCATSPANVRAHEVMSAGTHTANVRFALDVIEPNRLRSSCWQRVATRAMTELASNQCVPCRGGVPPLKGAELERLVREVDHGWRVIG